MMTVAQLIERLQDFPPEAEVRLAFQPAWPFEHTVGRIASNEDAAGSDDEDDDSDDDTEAAQVVYIGEGRQLGYLSGAASRALGWGRAR